MKSYHKYYLNFEFTETEDEAKSIVAERNRSASPYARRKHPAHYTPWESQAAKCDKHFVVFYYV